ncbi:MAG: PH domain-containing protein [Solirubrobacteraceae bacterium]
MTGTPRSEPSNRLPIATRTMWLSESFGTCLVLIAVAGTLTANAAWFPLVLAIAVVAAAVLSTFGLSIVRYRRWRWELQEEELDLLHGAWRVVRTIVPVTRIQHVSVERTGWTDVFGLVRLHVHTAAGKTTIPGLQRPQADDLRDRILAKLRTPDDL